MTTEPDYAGQGLGLPERGVGSVGTFPRRLLGVFIDWMLCLLIAFAVFSVPFGAAGGQAFVPLAIFAAMNILLVSTIGTTIGHRIVGLQVQRLASRPVQTPAGLSRLTGPPGFGAGVLRTVLLCLFIPALIPNLDNRGLHDQAAGTIIIRTR